MIKSSSFPIVIAICALVTLTILTTRTIAFTRNIGVDGGWPKNPIDDYLHKPHNLSASAEPEFQTFTQIRDHFNVFDLATFKQRYLVNDEFYQPHDPLSPVFLFVGAEGTLSKKWVTSGIAAEYARQVGAKLMALEHRYYGESVVVPDLTTKNLQWLTTYQAVEDIANFITAFPELSRRPWVLFGGSYGGSLVAWTRLMKPNLIAAAISASGPFDPVIDFTDYLLVAQNAMEYYGGKRCLDNMEKANKDLYDIYFSSPQQAKFDDLTKKLNLCTPLKTGMDALNTQSFWQSLTDSFASIVQYNKETVADDVLNIAKVCQLLESGTNKLDTLIQIHNKVNGVDNCRDWDFEWQVKQLSGLQPGPNAAYRSWIWQTCSMYGFYQTNIGQTRIFGQQWDVTFFEQICQGTFGNDWTLARLEHLSKRWIASTSARDWRVGGVIFTNGNIDPWSALSIYKENPYMFSYSHYINGTSHCATLYPSMKTDPLPLQQARDSMFKQLSKILQNFPFTLQNGGYNPYP